MNMFTTRGILLYKERIAGRASRKEATTREKSPELPPAPVCRQSACTADWQGNGVDARKQ